MESTQLERCLGLVELTALGIGATLGAGIYVVTPTSTAMSGGPAMCISFVIAAIASVLSGLCYAELGARVPRAGSAYVYSYVAVGELWAFIVGWNMILEYVIGTASVARAAVQYIDVLAGGALEKAFRAAMPINVSFLGAYFDPIALFITLMLTVLLAVGVSESTFLNNIMVLINCGILTYIMIVGFYYADTKNWNYTLDEIHEVMGNNGTEYGTGGFMPYGFGGVMTAASAAFYSFVGFDCIATTGEEVKNPRRNIPLSIILSLTVCATAYVLISMVFSLDTPYFQLSEATLLPSVPFGKIVVSVGAILCASTSLLGGMFPLPRVVYAMAEDGLLFSWLAVISPRYKTPLIATFLSGILTAAFAALFDIDQLVNMLSIGTLMAYSLVAASVLILRYRETFIDIVEDDEELRIESDERSDSIPEFNATNQADDSSSNFRANEPPVTASQYILALVDFSSKSNPKRSCEFTSMLSIILTCLGAVFMFLVALAAMFMVTIAQGQVWPYALIGIFGALTIFCVIRLAFLPQNRKFNTFQVPGVPLLPLAALGVNFYLLVSLDVNTWIRFGVWMGLGFIIYFFYSIWASKERDVNRLSYYANQSPVASGHANQAYGTTGVMEARELSPSPTKFSDLPGSRQQASSSFSSRGSSGSASKQRQGADESTPALS